MVALEVARIDRNSLHGTAQNRDLRSDMRKSVSPLNRTAGFLTIEAEELLQTVSKPDSQVGHMPPEPPTIRGKIGAVFVRLVRRALFWYTPRINELNLKMAELLRGHAERIAVIADTLDQAQLTEAQFRSKLNGLYSAQAQLHSDVETSRATQTRLLAKVEQLRADLDAARETIRTLEQGREQWQDTIQQFMQPVREVSDVIGGMTGEVQAIRTRGQEFEKRLGELAERHRHNDRYAHQTRAELYAQQGRISILMQERGRSAQKEAPASIASVARSITTEELGSLYLEFENAFRGSRADIKQRVTVYLPQLTGRTLGTSHMPVLDLGCGRGEWLEVLVENGLTGVGVDSNEAFASECRDRGLTVHVADAISYLRQRPSESEGAVTAFHVVEHLPFRVILDLLDQAVRVLKPGGVLILETPNPANLIVGANSFYLNPSHIRPLPSELLRFVVESRGFCHVETVPLHPLEDCYRLEETGNGAAKLLNDLVCSARDYAIIAERP